MPDRNVYGRKVRGEMFVVEKFCSRPKCPWPKHPTIDPITVIVKKISIPPRFSNSINFDTLVFGTVTSAPTTTATTIATILKFMSISFFFFFILFILFFFVENYLQR